jgi:hypothetical protein
MVLKGCMIIVTYARIVKEVMYDILTVTYKCICKSQNVAGEKQPIGLCIIESGDTQMDICTYA